MIDKRSSWAVWNEGRPLLACWIQLFDAGAVEVLALCGYDVLILDLEHGLGSLESAVAMMRTAKGAGVEVLVRAPSHEPALLRALIDHGVRGIVVPMVESAGVAADIVAACRFPPRGRRGVAIGASRGARYGFDVNYVDAVGSNTLIVCQIETRAGVERAEEIARTDGVDMLFIGRNDLAADCGHLGDLDHPDVERLVNDVFRAGRAAGKRLGTVPSAARSWAALLQYGFDMVVPSSDIRMLSAAGSMEVGLFKRSLEAMSAPTA